MSMVMCLGQSLRKKIWEMKSGHWSHILVHIMHPQLSPSLPISHLGTSHYPPNFTTTLNFTPRHIRLPTQFHHHSQFPTWAHLITHPPPHHFQFHTWVPLITIPLSITSTFTPGHLPLPTHFPHHFKFHTWAPQSPPPPTYIRQSMSALMGNPDPYPWVFQIENAIPRSVWVSATGWPRAMSQKHMGFQVPVGPGY